MVDQPGMTFPYISNKNWWDLRRRFVQAPPAQVTASYLEATLNLSANTAVGLLSQLQSVGLIDDGHRLTDRAHEWRSDEGYPAACLAIIDEVYPQELRDAFPPPNPARDGAVRWFMKAMKTGRITANQKAAFYELLAIADLKQTSGERTIKPASAQGSGSAPREGKRSAIKERSGGGVRAKARDAADGDLLEYPFPLRSGGMAYLRFPRGLTTADATRIGTFVRSLAIDSSEEESESTEAR